MLGTVNVIDVLVLTVTTHAAVRALVTSATVAEVRFVPAMTTDAPTRPVDGATLVIVGVVGAVMVKHAASVATEKPDVSTETE
jgi:hypothetical protein